MYGCEYSVVYIQRTKIQEERNSGGLQGGGSCRVKHFELPLSGMMLGYNLLFCRYIFFAWAPIKKLASALHTEIFFFLVPVCDLH